MRFCDFVRKTCIFVLTYVNASGTISPRKEDKQMFNRDLFRAKCIEHGMNMNDAAVIIGINPTTLFRKMNGTSVFTRNEIQLFRAALHLTVQETDAIFFS